MQAGERTSGHAVWKAFPPIQLSADMVQERHRLQRQGSEFAGRRASHAEQQPVREHVPGGPKPVLLCPSARPQDTKLVGDTLSP